MTRSVALEAAWLPQVYADAKVAVIRAGFWDEIEWQASRDLHDMTEESFMSETAWVILSSGLSAAVVERVFPAITDAHYGWRSAARICSDAGSSTRHAAAVFANTRKLRAIRTAAEFVNDVGVEEIIRRLERDGPAILRPIPFIGRVTSQHLAKNLGLPVSKADRHLTRMAQASPYDSVDELCDALASFFGEPVPVVDIVLWRFATLHSDYIRRFYSRFAGVGST